MGPGSCGFVNRQIRKRLRVWSRCCVNSIWTFPCPLLRAQAPPLKDTEAHAGQERDISAHGWEGTSLSCLSSAFTPLTYPASSRWASGP